MKRCPICSRTYPDDQNFCFDDGTTLEAAAPPGPYDQSEAPTANYPYPGGAAQTDIRHVSPTAGNRPPGTVPPPPSQTPPYMMMTPYAQKRSPLPWILLGLGVLIIGVGLIVFLASRNPGQTGISAGTTPGATPGTTPRTTPGTTPSTPSTPTSTPPGSWETVNGDGFTISMPGTPSHDDDTVASAAGPLPIHLYTLSEGYEGFIAGYTEYPDFIFSSAKPDDLMDSAANGAISNIQGEITSQRSITLDGNPGREIVGTSPSKNIAFTVRIYLVKPRMYMILYTQYGKDKAVSVSGERFLDSLTLTK
ncbi:MAG TPA: hypothetical protein VN256_01460 [Pyrinomonadaceae bacterium]|nr:hypothetical protein [Pyrinomonadaceae bacterium]